MKRTVERLLPDGSSAFVQPFHVSMEGLEKTVLFRDEEDYGVMVKYIAISAFRTNVIVIIYAVVSNHSHIAVLAQSQVDADSFGRDLKRVYSMWFNKKYNESSILKRTDVKAIPLEDYFHIRNALAYIPRNAADNGCSPHDYKWSGFRAMFKGNASTPGGKQISSMTKQERRRLMHTGENLKGVKWTLDDEGNITPESFCDSSYLEQAFCSDAAYFYKLIGSINTAEMKEVLIDSPRRFVPDSEFYKNVDDTSRRWFSAGISELTIEKKSRLISFIWRTKKTTVPQLARTMGLDRTTVQSIISRK